MNSEEIKYHIALTLIPGVGCINAKKLIAYTGSAEAVFTESKKNLLKIPGVGEFLANEIVNAQVIETADKEMNFIAKENIDVILYTDARFPTRLKHCNDAPSFFFMKGNTNLNCKKVISIIGTRNATDYGKDICNKLIKDISENHKDTLIVSGLAYGIDIAAHKAALKYNLPTVAVLGTSLDTIYPAQHKNYAKEIEDRGALISEFLSNTIVDRANFVRRNRIVAGMADATIVVESAESGGALITAEIANSYNRDVFAFPGRINDKYSEGCNKLIKTHKAALIEGLSDLEYILGWTKEESKVPQQTRLFVELSPDEQKISDYLKGKEKVSIDLVCVETQLPMSKVSSLLLNMEFSGLVKCFPGKLYELV